MRSSSAPATRIMRSVPSRRLGRGSRPPRRPCGREPRRPSGSSARRSNCTPSRRRRGTPRPAPRRSVQRGGGGRAARGRRRLARQPRPRLDRRRRRRRQRRRRRARRAASTKRRARARTDRRSARWRPASGRRPSSSSPGKPTIRSVDRARPGSRRRARGDRLVVLPPRVRPPHGGEHAVVCRLQRHVQMARHQRLGERLEQLRRSGGGARSTTDAGGPRPGSARQTRDEGGQTGAAARVAVGADVDAARARSHRSRLRRAARARSTAASAARLQGRPRTRRTAQYEQRPAQPSCTFRVKRVRPWRARERSRAPGAAGRPAPRPQRRRAGERPTRSPTPVRARGAPPSSTPAARPAAAGATRETRAGELLRPQRGGAAGHHDRPAVGGEPPGELARRALGLAGDRAGQQHLHVGLGGVVDRSAAARRQTGEHRLAVGLAHLAAGEGGVDAQRRAPRRLRRRGRRRRRRGDRVGPPSSGRRRLRRLEHDAVPLALRVGAAPAVAAEGGERRRHLLVEQAGQHDGARVRRCRRRAPRA